MNEQEKIINISKKKVDCDKEKIKISVNDEGLDIEKCDDGANTVPFFVGIIS